MNTEAALLLSIIIFDSIFVFYLIWQNKKLKEKVDNPDPHTHSMWIKLEDKWHFIATTTNGNLVVDNGKTKYEIASIYNYNKPLNREEFVALFNSGIPLSSDEVDYDKLELYFGSITNGEVYDVELYDKSVADVTNIAEEPIPIDDSKLVFYGTDQYIGGIPPLYECEMPKDK